MGHAVADLPTAAPAAPARTSAGPAAHQPGLDDLLDAVGRLDPVLAAQLASRVDALRATSPYGPGCGQHEPEPARLPHSPIRRGATVATRLPRSADGDRTWTVEEVDEATSLALLDDATIWPFRELVEIRDLADVNATFDPAGVVTGPGLEPGRPTHQVIGGENEHVLRLLTCDHAGQVDLIYLDPPYNTGAQTWIYHDDYAAPDTAGAGGHGLEDADGGRHGRWLAFMRRRLVLARDLLAPTGVIMVSIGDDEHHHLRMLLDQVFGPGGFVANIAWQGTGRNDVRYTAGGLDYMLVYARDEKALRASGARWRERKPGIDLAMSAAAAAWRASGGDPAEATRRYRARLRALGARLTPAVSGYDVIDGEGRPCRPLPLSAVEYNPGTQYDIPHPVTGRPVARPAKGWRYSQATMRQHLDAGRILFGPDESKVPAMKGLLTDQCMQPLSPSFTQRRSAATKRLRGMLGHSRFPYPKDHEVLMRWIGAIAPADGLIVDFFGGSGSTTEAVLRLNAADGGTRRSILVTNNELAGGEAADLADAGFLPGDPEWEARGVFESVTVPRITTVVTGIRPDGTRFDAGLPARVELSRLVYADSGSD